MPRLPVWKIDLCECVEAQLDCTLLCKGRSHTHCPAHFCIWPHPLFYLWPQTPLANGTWKLIHERAKKKSPPSLPKCILANQEVQTDSGSCLCQLRLVLSTLTGSGSLGNREAGSFPSVAAQSLSKWRLQGLKLAHSAAELQSLSPFSICWREVKKTVPHFKSKAHFTRT